jgi:hypothetical protein
MTNSIITTTTVDNRQQPYYHEFNIPTRPLPQGMLNYGGFFFIRRLIGCAAKLIINSITRQASAARHAQPGGSFVFLAVLGSYILSEWKTYKLGEMCTDISYGYTESATTE